MMENPPAFAQTIPKDAICKWGVSWMLEPEIYASHRRKWETPEVMTPGVKPPTKINMAHLHFGTGWWGCSPRGTLEISRFFRYIPLVKQVGFQGLCTHGENSSLFPASELNYHVFAALAENAFSTPEQIVARSVGQLLGDDKLGLDILTAYKERHVPKNLPPDVAGAAEKAKGQQKVRLNWLTFDLHRLSDQLRRSELGY
jgi:hypothetical protein